MEDFVEFVENFDWDEDSYDNTNEDFEYFSDEITDEWELIEFEGLEWNSKVYSQISMCLN